MTEIADSPLHLLLISGNEWGADEVSNYHNIVDHIVNYRRTVDVFHVIKDFCLRHVV